MTIFGSNAFGTAIAGGFIGTLVLTTIVRAGSSV